MQPQMKKLGGRRGFLWHPEAIIQTLLLFVQYFYFALCEDWPLIEAVAVFFCGFFNFFYSYQQKKNITSTASQVLLTGISV